MKYDFKSTRQLISKFVPQPVYKSVVENVLDNIEKSLDSSLNDLDIIWKTTALRDRWITDFVNRECYTILVPFMKDLLFGSYPKFDYRYKRTVYTPNITDPTKMDASEVSVSDKLTKSLFEIYRDKFDYRFYPVMVSVFKLFYMMNNPAFFEQFPEFNEVITNRLAPMESLPRNYLIVDRVDTKPYFAGETCSIIEDASSLSIRDVDAKVNLAICHMNNLAIYDRALRKAWLPIASRALATGTASVPTEILKTANPPVPGRLAPEVYVKTLSDTLMLILDSTLLLVMAYSDISYFDSRTRRTT